MLRLSEYTRKEAPYLHLFSQNAIDEELLKKLADTFPDVEKIKGKSSGRVYISNKEKLFPKVYEGRPEWKKFLHDLTSADFAMELLNMFRQDMIDNESALPCYKPFKLSKPDAQGRFPEGVQMHIDISKGFDDYDKYIHHDGSQRVISFLIYFNEPQQDGGELIMYQSDPDKKVFETGKDGVPTKIKEHTRLKPTPNTSLIWLSTPDSYHEVSLIKNTQSPRLFLYGSITFNRKFAWKYGGKWMGDERTMRAYAKEGPKRR